MRPADEALTALRACLLPSSLYYDERPGYSFSHTLCGCTTDRRLQCCCLSGNWHTQQYCLLHYWQETAMLLALRELGIPAAERTALLWRSGLAGTLAS